MNDRWIINKAGLINFWYYNEPEEFEFSNGRLLLRGANGSGKSVTMQSFVPLLLDGNQRPDRLDPFGSRARRIENYMLGEDGELNERTGYLYMEFVKKEANLYMTIGMGINARKNKPIKSWYFIIKDGRRVGKDILLYKQLDKKYPLSRKELENRLGAGGVITDKQREYMALVNDNLFGFESVEKYDELLKLLIQIRSPKLSKEFKPTTIYDIMKNSLQPLTDNDLRPMSEAIENMDDLQNKLEILKQSKKSAQNIKRTYDSYNKAVLIEKANKYVSEKDKQKELTKKIKDFNQKLDSFTSKNKENLDTISELDIRHKTLLQKIATLKENDIYEAKEKYDNKKAELEKFINDKDAKENQRERKNETLIDVTNKIKKANDSLDIKIKESLDSLENLNDISEDIYFDEQLFLYDEIKDKIEEEYNFSYIERKADDYKKEINIIKDKYNDQNREKIIYDNYLEQYDNTKSEKEKLEREQKQIDEQFNETINEYNEKLYKWENNNIELKIEKSVLANIANQIDSYGEKTTYDDIISSVRKDYDVLKDKINSLKNTEEIEKEKIENNLIEKQEELSYWKNKKDPEPDSSEEIKNSRKILESKKIPFIPLYKAVDFTESFNEDTKNNIEEALLNMGLLDALIIPQKYRQEVLKEERLKGDKYIFSKPQILKHELSKYLKKDKRLQSNITMSDIEDAIKSILLDDENETFISEEGLYGIGIIRGKTSGTYKAKYIGTASRKKYKEEIIEKISVEILEINKELQVIKSNIDGLEKRISKLDNEYKDFPNKDDIELAYNQKKDIQSKIIIKENEIKERREKAENQHKILNNIELEIARLTDNKQIPKNYEGYKKALDDIGEYINKLRLFKSIHNQILSEKLLLDSHAERKDNIEQDIDEILYELNNLNIKIKETNAAMSSLEELLSRKGYNEIADELKKAIDESKKIPNKITSIKEENAGLKEKINHETNNLEKTKESKMLQDKRTEITRDNFYNELKLSYTTYSEDFLGTPEIIVKENENMLKTKSINDYYTSLNDSFYNNNGQLIDYNLTINQKFTGYDEELDNNLQELQKNAKRYEIKARKQGKEVNFYEFIELLKDDIIEQEQLFKEKDKELFEDILIHNVGNKIKARINNSQRWVNNMNDLMEKMDTSSGLKFSLKWKSKKPDTEEQMDTSELVQLLRKENLIKQVDIEKMSRHFRSRLDEARKIAEEKGNIQSFHNIVKSILDFREWFEFQLSFQRKGENKKELTNNQFFKFSGGEKAMAMYVPLFTSVYAKYNGARKDSPKLISLDEAFAGVDEKNIKDMFRLLIDLDLNFVMNSQILWGDYETVPSLAICELLRPENAKFVSVIRFIWNAKLGDRKLHDFNEII